MAVLKKFVKKLVVGYKASLKAPPEEPIPVRVVEPMLPSFVGTSPINLGVGPVVEAKTLPVAQVGFEVPKFSPKQAMIESRALALIPEGEKEIIPPMAYSLIPRKPGKNEPIFAYVKIYWVPELSRYVYQVVEPELTEKIAGIMNKIKDLLEQKLDINFAKLKKFEARDYLRRNVVELLGYFGFDITDTERRVLLYYIERDFIGLGKLEPLMNDENIEDISCDGVGIPLYVFHRNPALSSVVTNVVFNDALELDSFITRLSQLCGKSISVASPLVDGSLPDGSRIQATLATDIARRGSNFTIRKFTEEPLTPVNLLNYNTIDVQVLAYLWLAVDYGKSILVCGGAASGKTTLLNVLSLFIRPERKIVSIEDTPELKLPHPHWIPGVARVPIATERGRKIGEVDLFDLLKESIRQRPDYIIVGEVRGNEAYVLFQQMATGHPSLATIHAENIPKLIDRLTTPPISLPPSLLGSLDLVVFLLAGRHRDKHVRRVHEVLEVIGIDQVTKEPITRRIFKWNPNNDAFDLVDKSTLLQKISEGTGLKEHQIKNELERRMLVLNWMKNKNITNYKDVFNVLNTYYSYPERVLAAISGEV
jgi:flagellar protein FlaI